MCTWIWLPLQNFNCFQGNESRVCVIFSVGVVGAPIGIPFFNFVFDYWNNLKITEYNKKQEKVWSSSYVG